MQGPWCRARTSLGCGVRAIPAVASMLQDRAADSSLWAGCDAGAGRPGDDGCVSRLNLVQGRVVAGSRESCMFGDKQCVMVHTCINYQR